MDSCAAVLAFACIRAELNFIEVMHAVVKIDV